MKQFDKFMTANAFQYVLTFGAEWLAAYHRSALDIAKWVDKEQRIHHLQYHDSE